MSNKRLQITLIEDEQKKLDFCCKALFGISKSLAIQLAIDELYKRITDCEQKSLNLEERGLQRLEPEQAWIPE